MNIMNCKTWIILNLERAQSRPHIRCPTISAAERAQSRADGMNEMFNFLKKKNEKIKNYTKNENQKFTFCHAATWQRNCC